MKTKFWIICLSVFFVSCLRNMHDIYTGGEEEEEEKINKDDFFDFTTVRNSQLIIDYGMKVQTAFYLYDEYPMELVGNTWEFKDINPIYAASTDMNGRFFSKVSLPAYLKKVWLVTDNVLVVSPVELEFLSDGLTFNYVDYKAQLSANGHSRAVMGGVSYPDGYDVLGNWNENGVPDYLLPEKLDIPGAFLERCSNLSRSIVVDNRNLLERFPELRTSGSNDMVITKSTGLVATYFDFSSTAWEDMVAYYTYKEGESVDIATIKKTILIPRSSRNAPKSLVGEQIKLKYWNKEQSKYEDEFPQGTHIGWILLGMGFGKEKGVFPRYSNPAYNDNKEQRSVLLSDPELDNCFFMAMEDNVDMRFNDVQFAIMASASSSVEPTPNIPDEVNKGEISYVVKGSLAYEDNWPDKNDYDMNDVVIYYSSTVVKDKSSNALVRTTTTFTPMNDGATYTNGFGFQLDYVGKEHIDLVQVSQEGNVIGKNFEPGIEKPVLILFSDIKPVLKKPVTVVIGFKKYDKVSDMDAYPPYNSFIFVNKRSHEVHLSGYKPTSVADESLRGTGSDLSQDSNGIPMYYIAEDNMPFAINISNSEFRWPSEKDEVNKGEISYVVKGSLAYEDNWPDKNDYDMNDVVIYYSSTVVKDKSSNALVRTTTTFTPMNDGATYTNGFGFQLDYVGKEHIDLVQVSQEGNVIGKNFEPGIEKPVLILFSDIKPVLKKPVTVVIGFKKYDKVSDMDAYPPYNSFIFVNKRSHEVHLSGYKPTSVADESLRGTGSDLSQDSNGIPMYYIAEDNMPFAINISNSEFRWPSEKVSITTYYPEFKQWRDSFGADYKDWYLHPKE